MSKLEIERVDAETEEVLTSANIPRGETFVFLVDEDDHKYNRPCLKGIAGHITWLDTGNNSCSGPEPVRRINAKLTWDYED